MNYMSSKPNRVGESLRTPSVVARNVGALMFLAACSAPDQPILTADESLSSAVVAYQALPDQHRLTLASLDEPGQRLHVLVTVMDSARGSPAALRAVTVYHTSNAGSYEESTPGDDSTARLRGTVTTDSAGRFLLETILPGAYGSAADQRHIHTRVSGARPESYDILFSQYLRASGRRWASRSGQAFVGTLWWRRQGELVMSVRMSVRGLEPREWP